MDHHCEYDDCDDCDYDDYDDEICFVVECLFVTKKMSSAQPKAEDMQQ